MKSSIKLRTESVLQVPFQNYEKNFTFIVNTERFDTNILSADLLSPTISKIHLSDPTIKEFWINTEAHGNFNHILNLLKFENEEIPEDEIPYLFEVLNILGIEKVNFNNNSNEEENTLDNILNHIILHQKLPQLFQNQLSKDISFFTSHFTELTDQLLREIEAGRNEIEKFVLDDILNSSDLQIETEDELLDFVNNLCRHDPKYACFYEYVDFKYVADTASIKNFVDIFQCGDMNHSIWDTICKRLEQEVKDDGENQRRHKRAHKKLVVEVAEKEKQLDGIMNYLKTHGNIKDEVNITFSSNHNNKDPFELLKYDDSSTSSFFQTSSEQDPWICFEFKKHKVMPTGYIIRSYNSSNHNHLKSWKIEGSNDQESWEILDSQTDNEILNGPNVIHLFHVSQNKGKSYKYVRIMETGPSWYGHDSMIINSIDFYGKIFG